MKSDNTARDPAQEGFVTEDQMDETTVDGRIWLKTITAKSIEAHPERANLHKRPVLCCRIAGEVRGTEQVPADPKNRDSEMLTVLVGEFVAESYNDAGEVFSFIGEWCGLPMGNNVMLARLQKMADAGVENPLLHFDLEFAALPASNPSGYRWGARNMMPVVLNDQSFLSPSKLAQRRLRARDGGLPEFAVRQIEHAAP